MIKYFKWKYLIMFFKSVDEKINYLKNCDLNSLRDFIINEVPNLGMGSFSKLLKKINRNEDIIKLTPFLNLYDNVSLFLRVQYIHYKINDVRKCPICGKLLNFNNLKKIYCSQKCYNKAPKTQEQRDRISKKSKEMWANRSLDEKIKIYNKVFETNFKRYGCKCTLNSTESIKKKKETWMKNYGVDNPLKSEIIKNKVFKTNLKKYGNKSPLHGPEQIKKKKETWMRNYGVDSPLKSNNVRNKIKETWMSNYGIDCPIKNDNVRNKMIETMAIFKPTYTRKIYEFPSGRKILYQGYEKIAIEQYLLKKYKEDDILNDLVLMNSFKFFYFYNGIKHQYLPDFYIKSENLIIEVKCTYTLENNIEINKLKFDSVIKNGYNIKIIVIDKVKGSSYNLKVLTYEDIKNM